MAQALASSAVPLCPVAEFLKRVDQVAVAKLACDVPAQSVPIQNLATDPNVAAALQDASGLVESAISVGGRYSQADVAAILAAPAGTAALGMLYRMVTDVAWAGLYERRPNKDMPTPASMERSLAWLDMLADGKRVFPFLETEAAGVIEKVETPIHDVYGRNGAVVQAQPFYGVRSDQQRRRYGGGSGW